LKVNEKPEEPMMTNKKMKVMPSILILFMSIGFHLVFAGEVTFFGPKQYTRSTGKSVTEMDTFICPPGYAGPGFTLRVIDGDSQGNHRVSSGVIKVNSLEVIGPSDFNQNVGLIERTIDLTAGNEISVKLNSKPNSFVIIDIYKFIPVPEATFTANPDTIQYQ
jgi:PKD repeat protein